MNDMNGTKFDVRKTWLPVSAVLGLLALVWGASSEMKAMRMSIDANARGIEQALLANRQMTETVRDLVLDRPTISAAKASILEAVRPLDTAMAELRAKVDALSTRLARVENNQEKDGK